MQVKVIQNSTTPVETLLNVELQNSVVFKAASAYLTKDGLGRLEQSIEKLLERDGCVSIAHAADCQITEPDAIQTLSRWNMDYGRMDYRVMLSLTKGPAKFHPKIYIASDDRENYTSVIGSSNLTLSGLKSNVEVNCVIRGSKTENAIRESNQVFESLITLPEMVVPDGEWIRRYTRLYDSVQKVPWTTVLPDELRELYRDLEGYSPQDASDLDWQPKTQVEILIKTMLDLESRGRVEPYDLPTLYAEMKRIAQASGFDYDWRTWENSVRRTLNTDVMGKSTGRALFERVGGIDSKSGLYKLTQKARTIAAEKARSSTE